MGSDEDSLLYLMSLWGSDEDSLVPDVIMGSDEDSLL